MKNLHYFIAIYFIFISPLFSELNPPDDVTISKIADDRYRFHWEGSDEETSYWIFSSPNWDFIPQIYLEEELLSFEEDQKVFFTRGQEIIIESPHRYFRLIAEKNGVFSPPSTLISREEFPVFHSRMPLKKSDAKAIKRLEPYLLPNDHPIKASLDRLFGSSRVLLNLKTLRAAGFVTDGPRKFTKIIVATHPDFPDYIFKLYLDAQRFEKPLAFHEYLMQRIDGAHLLQKEIDKNGWQSLFKVPNKWIYALPASPSAPSEFMAKNFLLVEDNMQIYSDEQNDKLWKSDHVSQEFLQIYFQLLTLTGYQDVKPANTPFSLDGKVAFVDTQTFLSEVRYSKMTPFLSPSNQKYWKSLIKTQLSH